MTKTCPHCGELNVTKAAECTACGEAFAPPAPREAAPGRDESEAMASVNRGAVYAFIALGAFAVLVVGVVFFVALFHYGAHAAPQ